MKLLSLRLLLTTRSLKSLLQLRFCVRAHPGVVQIRNLPNTLASLTLESLSAAVVRAASTGTRACTTASTRVLS